MNCFVGGSHVRRYPADGRAAPPRADDEDDDFDEAFEGVVFPMLEPGDLLRGLFLDCFATGMINSILLYYAL